MILKKVFDAQQIERLWPLTNPQLQGVFKDSELRSVGVITAKEGVYTIKLANRYKSADEVRGETRIYDYLATHSFDSATQLLKTRSGDTIGALDNRQSYILKFIDGDFPKDPVVAYTELGRLTAALNQYTNYPYPLGYSVTASRPFMLDMAKEFSFGKDYQALCHQLPDFSETPHALVHGDASHFNIIETPAKTYVLIDFDDAGHRPAIFDLACSLITRFIDPVDGIREAWLAAFYASYQQHAQQENYPITTIYDAALFYALYYLPYSGNRQLAWGRIQWAQNHRAIVEQMLQKYLQPKAATKHLSNNAS